MKITPLSKEDAVELEQNSCCIDNRYNLNGKPTRSRLSQLRCMMYLNSIHGWYHRYDLRPGYVREQWNKLTELFGMKPLYYVTYSYRNALWGFKWNDQPVLIYKDRRGMKIQVPFKFQDPQRFLKQLRKVLYKKEAMIMERKPCTLQDS